MHTIDYINAGSIDGTLACTCGYTKYTTYPNRGWGARSVGQYRPNGKTKREWIKDKLVAYYIGHVAREQRNAELGYS